MEHPGNRRDGIPVASGRRDAVEPVQRTEISDDLHVAPVHPDDESVSSEDGSVPSPCSFAAAPVSAVRRQQHSSQRVCIVQMSTNEHLP